VARRAHHNIGNHGRVEHGVFIPKMGDLGTPPTHCERRVGDSAAAGSGGKPFHHWQWGGQGSAIPAVWARRFTVTGWSHRLLTLMSGGCPAVWQADKSNSPQRLFGEALNSPIILWLCAGRPHRDDITAVAEARGVRVLAIDIKRGGREHDLRTYRVRQQLHMLCAARRRDGTPVVVGAHLASPCRSFSPLNAGLRLRTVDAPDGEEAPIDFAAYIAAENLIISECAKVAHTLMTRGAPVTWENSPSLDRKGVPWHWSARKDCASLWHTTPLHELAAAHPVVRVTAAMCRFGSQFRKYFTILAPASMRETLQPLVRRWCPESGGVHGRHPAAEGFDSHGNSRAEAAGQYPRALNEFLLDALVTEGGAAAFVRPAHSPYRSGERRCELDRDDRRAATAGDADREGDHASDSEPAGASSDTDGSVEDDVHPRPAEEQGPVSRSRARTEGMPGASVVSGGRVTEGPELGADVRAAVEKARNAPAGFSSFRNLRPAAEDELWREPLPQLRELARGLRPTEEATFSANTNTEGLTADRHVQWDGKGDWRKLASNAPRSRGVDRLTGRPSARRRRYSVGKKSTATSWHRYVKAVWRCAAGRHSI